MNKKFPITKPKTEVLRLTIKKEYFDQISSGEKKIEYRNLTPYYFTRLMGRFYKEVIFVNGYSRFSPRIRMQVTKILRTKLGFEIHLGKKIRL